MGHAVLRMFAVCLCLMNVTLMAAFVVLASMTGNCRHRTSSEVALRRGRGIGCNWATGRPSFVTRREAPRSTRVSTSPPWLRSSRTVTSSAERRSHRWDGALIPAS